MIYSNENKREKRERLLGFPGNVCIEDDDKIGATSSALNVFLHLCLFFD
jgi:hypothetical protein